MSRAKNILDLNGYSFDELKTYPQFINIDKMPQAKAALKKYIYNKQRKTKGSKPG